MKNNLKAMTYAQCLYTLSVEQNITNEVLYEIKSFSKIQDKDIIKILQYPLISKEKKKELVDSLSEVGIRDIIINLIKVLIDFNDINLFGTVLQEFEQMYKIDNDVKIIEVTFAKEPSDKVVNSVVKMLETKLKKFVVIKKKIDPSLIAGIKIEFDSQIVDGSVKRQLSEMVKSL